MASFSVIGFISTIRYLANSVLIYIDEFKNGYKQKNGTRVEDRFYTWKIIYPSNFKKYVAEHFAKNMLVEAKGDILPYVYEKGEEDLGYSIKGQCLNIYSYPRLGAKTEMKMVKESQLHSMTDENPDIDGFMQEDF